MARSSPPRLRDLNYIFFYEDPKVSDSGFGTGLAKLIAALNTDFDWLREHTRYLQRATEWDRGRRPTNRLLSGDDIVEAKAWAARRPKNAPELTALHLDFIRASEEEAQARSSTQRKQLEAMAAAQAEREKALHQAEQALKQAADAQRKRARIRNIAFVVVSILACLATSAMVAGWWLYGQADRLRRVAEEQKAVAEEQRQQADDILAGATNIIVDLQPHLDIDTRKEVFAVFRRGADHGDIRSMDNLGRSFFTVLACRRTTARRASGTRRPPPRTTRAPCSTSACFMTTVKACRRTTPRRASGTRRPLTRAKPAP